jgi:hypothetical protein
MLAGSKLSEILRGLRDDVVVQLECYTTGWLVVYGNIELNFKDLVLVTPKNICWNLRRPAKIWRHMESIF